MNESIKNMIERRSVRGYKPDMIPKEDLDLILEAGTYAATGMGCLLYTSDAADEL